MKLFLIGYGKIGLDVFVMEDVLSQDLSTKRIPEKM